MNGEVASPTMKTGSRLVLFLALQLLLVGAAIAGVAYRALQIDERAGLPPLRETPLEVAPQFDEPLMVTDEQLVTALRKLRPRPEGKDTKIGNIDHHLRFWGPKARFRDPKFIDGEALRQLLTDDRRFQALFGEKGKEKPLLIEMPKVGGIRVRELEGAMSSPHNDHTMASLAEVGTPLSFPIVTPRGDSTFRAIVEQSLRDFSLNQVEYEWSAVTFALFVQANRWVTTEGQEVSFDVLADRIMRQDMPQGVCMGFHRLHALVMLLRVNEHWDGPQPMLSPEKEAEIVDYLEAMTTKLIAHQHADGFWNVDWPSSTPKSQQPTTGDGDDLGSRIIATGHALEWWALVPNKYAERLLPPRNVRVAAAQWLVRTINEMSDEAVLENSSFLSHAGRALALWRGKYPHQVELTVAGSDNS
jgi:hypothetical protein